MQLIGAPDAGIARSIKGVTGTEGFFPITLFRVNVAIICAARSFNGSCVGAIYILHVSD